jgi:hypothetical protein
MIGIKSATRWSRTARQVADPLVGPDLLVRAAAVPAAALPVAAVLAVAALAVAGPQ